MQTEEGWLTGEVGAAGFAKRVAPGFAKPVTPASKQVTPASKPVSGTLGANSYYLNY